MVELLQSEVYVLPHVAALLGMAPLCVRTARPMSLMLLTTPVRAPAEAAVETGSWK